MEGKQVSEVIEEKEGMGRIEAILIFCVAAFDLAVVARGIRADELVSDTQSVAAVASNRVGRSCLLLEKRLVNSKLLSIWTHWTRMPLRAYYLPSLLRKSAEE